ncbi:MULTISPECIES: protein kinase [unclassified Ruminococcus]|uniref:protein kinase domain-containing protein n=1 Tax=unclassified Ruminococcus TaxID=2608920 RepID=UPI00210D2B51|nr:MULTISPECIES: protein kinase [unclassified Ruminococcus]
MGTCYNCFQDKGTSDICSHCGFDSRKNREKYPLALPYGTVLGGKYIIGRVLGQGGFGITYLAQDYHTKELIAVKEYFPDSLAMRTNEWTVSSYTGEREENFLYGKECFLNEAQTLSEFIDNKNIVSIYSYFEENNTAYFTMEYIRGISLQDYINEHGGKISWEDAKRIFFPVMDALSDVHSKGIVHRDISPDNIYITNDGMLKLLDFGAARYSIGDKSRSLDVVLKHGYAPKEQYTRRGKQGPYTDVYALAATMYRSISGRVPPDSIDRMENDELILPSSLGSDIPAIAQDALVQALAVQADDRFQNIQPFKNALESADISCQDSTSQSDKFQLDTSNSDLPKTDLSLPDNRKKHKLLIGIGVSAVALVAISILLISLFLNKGSSDLTDKASYTSAVIKTEEETTTQKEPEKETQEETEEPEVIVSSYEDMSFADAKKELESLGFTVKSKTEYSNSVKEDYVISQSIEEGTKVVSPSTITLTVSKGKKPVQSQSSAVQPPKEESVSPAPTGNRVDFYYYSLVVPSDWVYSTNAVTGEVTFYESYNYENNYHAGRLFSINVFRNESEIDEFISQGRPNTTIIGESNGMYFTVTFPTDLQYMNDAISETKYKAAQEQIDSVLSTIVFS